MPKSKLTKNDAIKFLQQCDSKRIVRAYLNFIKANSNLNDDLNYHSDLLIFDLLVERYSYSPGELNERAIYKLAKMIRNVSLGELSDLEALSETIRDGMKTYLVRKQDSLEFIIGDIPFNRFYATYVENLGWKKVVSEEFFNHVCASSIYKHVSSFAEGLRQKVCEDAPAYLDCASIPFDNPERTQTILFARIKEHIKTLVSDILPWTVQKFDEVIKSHLLKGPILTSWDKLEDLMPQIQQELSNAAYETFQTTIEAYIDFIETDESSIEVIRKHLSCITQEAFLKMVEEGILVKKPEGKIQVTKQIDWPNFVDSVVDYWLKEAAISVTPDQRKAIVEQTSATLKVTPTFDLKNCEAEFNKLQIQVKKSFFSIVLKEHFNTEGLSRSEVREVWNSFQDLWNQNIKRTAGSKIGLDSKFLDRWVNDQVERLNEVADSKLEVMIQDSNALYSTEGSSPEAKTLVPMLDEGKEIGQAYYQLTNPPAELGRNSGSYSTTHALPTSDASVLNVSPNLPENRSVSEGITAGSVIGFAAVGVGALVAAIWYIKRSFFSGDKGAAEKDMELFPFYPDRPDANNKDQAPLEQYGILEGNNNSEPRGDGYTSPFSTFLEGDGYTSPFSTFSGGVNSSLDNIV